MEDMRKLGVLLEAPSSKDPNNQNSVRNWLKRTLAALLYNHLWTMSLAGAQIGSLIALLWIETLGSEEVATYVLFSLMGSVIMLASGVYVRLHFNGKQPNLVDFYLVAEPVLRDWNRLLRRQKRVPSAEMNWRLVYGLNVRGINTLTPDGEAHALEALNFILAEEFQNTLTELRTAIGTEKAPTIKRP